MENSVRFGSVICQVDACEKFPAIDEVIDRCSVFHDLPDIDRFKRAVRRREHIETTGIGHGVAIAHGKILHLDHLRVGLGLSVAGVQYDAKDDQPVHLLFVIASSPSQQFEYIKALSTILRSVRDDNLRDELLCLDSQVLTGACSLDGSDGCLRFLHMMASQHFAWLWNPDDAQGNIHPLPRHS
ncbi:MAG: PTS sugar transporter subunit IIA [Sphaerochaetaceae bacterium]